MTNQNDTITMKRFLIMTMTLCLVANVLSAQEDTTKTVCPAGGEQLLKSCICGCRKTPVNNYSGLNSLRARLANPTWDGLPGMIGTGLKLEDGRIRPLSSPAKNMPRTQLDTSSAILAVDNPGSENGYVQAMGRGETPVGAPLLVFFRIAGTRLTDESQKVNIEAVASLAKAQELRIRITGAADSATGSAEKNAELALARAEYVAGLLKEQGIPEGRIEVRSEGGIASYSPVSANRNCRIELSVR